MEPDSIDAAPDTGSKNEFSWWFSPPWLGVGLLCGGITHLAGNYALLGYLEDQELEQVLFWMRLIGQILIGPGLICTLIGLPVAVLRKLGFGARFERTRADPVMYYTGCGLVALSLYLLFGLDT